MSKHIRFSEEINTFNRRLPFFLAAEEWVARVLPAGDYFFSWQVDPTVICGRNQEIEKEVALDYCRLNGIDVVRRRSGGGAVFADRENFMFSFITHGDKVMEQFARYSAMIAGALRELGVEAEVSGRNDITINGLKVAGNAFYHLPGRCIAHGTMLYNFDPVHIANSLTPSKAKMESKGVKSVQKRVTCLKEEGIQLSKENFQSFMIEHLTDGDPYVISREECAEIEAIEQAYYNPEFLRIGQSEDLNSGNQGSHRICRNSRIEGLGEFCVEYVLNEEDQTIRNFRISGDFFMSSDVDALLCEPLSGARASRESLEKCLSAIDLSTVIPGLTTDILVSLIIE